MKSTVRKSKNQTFLTPFFFSSFFFSRKLLEAKEEEKNKKQIMFETIIFEDLVEYGRENLETIHYFIEGALFLFILFLFFQKPTKRQTEKMKPHHEKILLDDFEPEPLAPSLSTRHKVFFSLPLSFFWFFDIKTLLCFFFETLRIVFQFDLQSLVTFDKGISFPKGKINGKEVQNLSSWNYLGFSVDPLYQENGIFFLLSFFILFQTRIFLNSPH